MQINSEKVSFIGSKLDQQAFFDKMQDHGLIQFNTSDLLPASICIRDAHLKSKQMHAILNKYEPIHDIAILSEMEIDGWLDHNFPLVADWVIAEGAKLQNIEAKEKQITTRMQILEWLEAPALDVCASELHKDGYALQILWCHEIALEEAAVKEEIADFVFLGIYQAKAFFFSLVKNKENAVSSEYLFDLMDDYSSLLDLKKNLMKIRQEKSYILSILQHLSACTDDIQSLWRKWLDKTDLLDVSSSTVSTCEDYLFYIDGWVASPQRSKVELIAKTNNIVLVDACVLENEKAPTILNNSGLSSIGQDIVLLYDVPSTQDIDPSPWVFWVSVFFTALIVGDAGYGMITMLIVMLSHFYCNYKGLITEKIKNLLHSGYLISSAIMLWGLTLGSIFCVDAKMDSWIVAHSPLTYLIKRKMKYHIEKQDIRSSEWLVSSDIHAYAKETTPDTLLHSMKSDTAKEALATEKDAILFELIILIGALHILLSVLISVIAKKNYLDFGWAFVILGGLLYVPTLFDANTIYTTVFQGPEILIENSLYLIGAGFAWVLVVGLLTKGLVGIFELMNGIQVFANILSYLRLYALMLAGSAVGNTFNTLGMKLPLILGIMVILFGHILNYVLNIMGVAIHVFRLHVLEWFGFIFSGEGILFNPFSKREKKYNKKKTK